METPQVKIIQVEPALVAVGKAFTGDYAYSPAFASEVQGILNASSVPFIPNKVLGVYYDNPETTQTKDLRCFQGFFPKGTSSLIDPSLSKIILEGKFLYTKVTGDPARTVFAGYEALFRHVQENGIALKSNAGYQVSTFENNEVTVEIYMEIL